MPRGYVEIEDVESSGGESHAVKESAATRKRHRELVESFFPEPGTAPFLCYDLENQYFQGPAKGGGAYASISILDPMITIERHHGKYHIAARFNVETTILCYEAQKRFK